MSTEHPKELFTQPIISPVSQASLLTSAHHIQTLNNSIINKISEGRYTINPKNSENPEIINMKPRNSYSVKLKKSMGEKEELENKLKELKEEIIQLKHMSTRELREIRGIKGSRVRGEEQEGSEGVERLRGIRREQYQHRLSLSERRNKQIERQKSKQERQQEQLNQIKKQSIEHKKLQISQRIKNLNNNSLKREESNQERNNKMKKILKSQREEKLSLHPFDIKQLEQSKKVMLEREEKYKPINYEQIEQHEQKMKEYLKVKAEEWKQKSQLLRRSVPKGLYESRHKKEQEKEEEERIKMKEKIDMLKRENVRRVRQYGERVKEEYRPEINPKLESEIVRRIRKQQQRLKEVERKKQQSQKLIKIKGEKYFQESKLVPKKLTSKKALVTEQVLTTEDKSPRYMNYLVHTERGKDYNRWADFNRLGESGERKMSLDIDKLRYQSERVEGELKRREQQHRLIRKKSEEELNMMDREYYQMMKMKLSALGS